MDAPHVPAHYTDLERVEQAVWTAFGEGASSRRSAFHQVTIASVGEDGAASARTVVLRGADEETRHLRFHTDIRSAKVASLRTGAPVVVLGYDHGAKIQIRARGWPVVHNRDGLTRHIWDEMPRMSKACYCQAIAPGTPVDLPQTAEATPLDEAQGYENFTIVMIEVFSLEWLYLNAAGHRRALVRYGKDVERTWLAP